MGVFIKKKVLKYFLMNKFTKKLFFLKLGIITTVLPFYPIQNLYGETLNKSIEENNINNEIDLQIDPYILGPGDELKIEVLIQRCHQVNILFLMMEL